MDKLILRSAAGLLLGLSLLAVFAPWLAPHDPYLVFPDRFSLPPFWLDGRHPEHWLGTDDLGRDLLSRLIFGARYSLGIGAAAVIVSVSLGLLLGLWAGYRGGKVDNAIMRGTDMMMALPNILLAIVIVAVLGPSLLNTILAVSLVSVPALVRVVRAQVMAERNKPYVQSAVSFGASGWRICFLHILPNIMATVIVQATLGFSDAVLNAAALGFLGLGAQAPAPEWGVMVADARAYIESAWWLVTLPGVCILLASACFNLLGDGLRDALDPRLKS